MTMTEFQARALRLLADNPGAGMKFLGRQLWPDSDMHRRDSKSGNGNTKGKAGWLCAGSYYAKLRKTGFVRYDPFDRTTYITEEGKVALEAFDKTK